MYVFCGWETRRRMLKKKKHRNKKETPTNKLTSTETETSLTNSIFCLLCLIGRAWLSNHYEGGGSSTRSFTDYSGSCVVACWVVSVSSSSWRESVVGLVAHSLFVYRLFALFVVMLVGSFDQSMSVRGNNWSLFQRSLILVMALWCGNFNRRFCVEFLRSDLELIPYPLHCWHALATTMNCWGSSPDSKLNNDVGRIVNGNP